MPLYNCNVCSFFSFLKTDHKRHLLTKKHIKNTEETYNENIKEPKRAKKEPKRAKMSQNEPVVFLEVPKFKCDFCDAKFKSKANKRRHELHRCSKNYNITQKLIESLKKEKNEKKQLYKQIEKLIDKAGNNSLTIQNTQNIKINSYGKEDLSHISDMFKTNLLKGPYGMIPKMIEAVHFNDNKPENKNIKFTNKRDNKIKIFSKDKWIYKNKDETISDLMDGKYFILDSHYCKLINNNNNNNNNNINIPQFYDKFRRLFDLKDNLLLEDQKKECELVLLNNR